MIDYFSLYYEMINYDVKNSSVLPFFADIEKTTSSFSSWEFEL